MAKLLELTLKVPESIPEGSPVEIVYGETYYAAAVAAGGMVQGKAGTAVGGLRPLLSSTGGPLLVYGGELGDEKPPLVSIRVKPRGAGVKGLAWEHDGHPRDTGGGKWDGSRYGTQAGERLSTETERVALAAQIAAAESATADLQAKKAAVDAGLAGITQGAAGLQQRVNEANALALQLSQIYDTAGILTALNEMANGMLTINGYAVDVLGQYRVLRVTASGPLAYRDNQPQNTTTLVDVLDSGQFGVRDNGDSFTLYRR